MNTKQALLDKHGGKTGYWEVRTPSRRDELGTTSHIMYCKGRFEDVLSSALKMRAFRDMSYVGSIEPITVVDVEATSP